MKTTGGRHAVSRAATVSPEIYHDWGSLSRQRSRRRGRAALGATTILKPPNGAAIRAARRRCALRVSKARPSCGSNTAVAQLSGCAIAADQRRFIRAIFLAFSLHAGDHAHGDGRRVAVYSYRNRPLVDLEHAARTAVRKGYSPPLREYGASGALCDSGV